MNKLPEIFYCNVCECVFDTHGKVYGIKEHRSWKFVNIGSKKVGVSSLPVKLKIFNFDDFVNAYVFGGMFQNYPCIAMDYYVSRKLTGKSMSIKDFKFKHKIR